jgi:hypothetical protein
LVPVVMTEAPDRKRKFSPSLYSPIQTSVVEFPISTPATMLKALTSRIFSDGYFLMEIFRWIFSDENYDNIFQKQLL